MNINRYTFNHSHCINAVALLSYIYKNLSIGCVSISTRILRRGCSVDNQILQNKIAMKLSAFSLLYPPLQRSWKGYILVSRRGSVRLSTPADVVVQILWTTKVRGALFHPTGKPHKLLICEAQFCRVDPRNVIFCGVHTLTFVGCTPQVWYFVGCIPQMSFYGWSL